MDRSPPSPGRLTLKSLPRLLLTLVLAVMLSGCGEPPQVQQVDVAPSVKPVTFNPPRDWYRVPISQSMRSAGQLYAWEVYHFSDRARITVSALGGGELNLLANISRWRRQVGLTDKITKEQLDQYVEPLDVDGQQLHYVEILGRAQVEGDPKQEAIWGAIFSAKGRTWYLKFTGPVSLAQREKDAFKAWIPKAHRALMHAVRDPSPQESDKKPRPEEPADGN